jgi:hypothetical protein
MTTPDQGNTPAASDPAAPQEWKPEPRQWTWKDLFTAPMLAFKPKCMLISALTLVALGMWGYLFDQFGGKLLSESVLWFDLARLIWVSVALVVFSLGATLVSVFMRADLLDDEFLSLREAFAQFHGRLVPALLVPLFLIGLVVGVNLFLIYVPQLLCSIPFAGSAIYALLYPLGYFLALFAVLLAIAVTLSVFVFPGIIAIRKHGWFDNVVDTIEAVGTKPHVLVGSLALTSVMVYIAFAIGTGGMSYLKKAPRASGVLPTEELRVTEHRADDVVWYLAHSWEPGQYLSRIYRVFDPRFMPHQTLDQPAGYGSPYVSVHSKEDWDSLVSGSSSRIDNGDSGSDAYYRWGTGLVTGIWQTFILAVLLGYCMNLLVGGGMLTYLLVREDDYWDDEDLEDLDKLAKELEEEAKRDEAAGTTPAAAAPAAPPAPPATPPASP